MNIILILPLPATPPSPFIATPVGISCLHIEERNCCEGDTSSNACTSTTNKPLVDLVLAIMVAMQDCLPACALKKCNLNNFGLVSIKGAKMLFWADQEMLL